VLLLLRYATFYWTQAAVGLSSVGKGFLAKECQDCNSHCYDSRWDVCLCQEGIDLAFS